jgi:hypothetical protein
VLAGKTLREGDLSEVVLLRRLGQGGEIDLG